jgi:hypothetical protein
MNSAPSISEQKKVRLRLGIQLVLWGIAVSMCAGAVDGVMKNYDLPVWLRIALALTPLLPLVAALRLQKKAMAHTDELVQHMAREAFAFAFYALFGLFICVDLLRNGGVLADFVWTSKWLMTAMGAMLALGFGLSSWRYR